MLQPMARKWIVGDKFMVRLWIGSVCYDIITRILPTARESYNAWQYCSKRWQEVTMDKTGRVNAVRWDELGVSGYKKGRKNV